MRGLLEALRSPITTRRGRALRRTIRQRARYREILRFQANGTSCERCGILGCRRSPGTETAPFERRAHCPVPSVSSQSPISAVRFAGGSGGRIFRFAGFMSLPFVDGGILFPAYTRRRSGNLTKIFDFSSRKGTANGRKWTRMGRGIMSYEVRSKRRGGRRSAAGEREARMGAKGGGRLAGQGRGKPDAGKGQA